MDKFNYHNKGFTLIELIIYIFIISILGILTMIIFYGITFYSEIYLDKTTIRSESFNLLNKLYFNSIIATSIEISSNSIKFNFNPAGYERLFLTSSKIYLENESTSGPFTSDKVRIDDFSATSSDDFYNVFIKISNLSGDQSLNLTSTLYLWSF